MPPSESYAQTLERVRRPAVHITYDLELNGATLQKELPFVVGVIADLSGTPAKPLLPLKQRKFVTIDRDNVDEVLAGCKPRVSFTLDNLLRDDDTTVAVEIEFERMSDFEPAQVARKVAPLRELLEIRERLSNLLNKMDGNDRLDVELQKVIWDDNALSTLSRDAKQIKPQAVIEDE